MTPPPGQAAAWAAELELAGQARAGEEQALAELYRRHHDQLFRHACRMLRDEAEAEDVMQETFARALAAIGRTSQELRFKAWVFRIATNLCLRRLTRRSRMVLTGVAAEAPARQDSPERELRQAELADRVCLALERLPGRYRRILVLRELDELSYEELGQVLELDPGRVKVTLHRARSRFAAELLAEQLLQDPSAEVRCGELARLLRNASRRRTVIRHLESCPACRRPGQRPAAELLSLLPGRAGQGSPDCTPDPLSRPGPGTAPRLAPFPALAQALSPVLLAVALVAALAAAPRVRRVARVESPARALTPGPAAVIRGVAPTSGNRSRAAGPMQADPFWPVMAATRPVPSRLGVKAGKGPRPRPAPVRPGSAGGDSPGPLPALFLALKLHFAPGELDLLRDGRAVPLWDPDNVQLKRGDILASRGQATFGVFLPWQQWLTVRGRLRLDQVPLRGKSAGPVTLTLLAGELFARARLAGMGLSIRVRDSLCRTEQGELRLRHEPDGSGRVESLSAHVQVEGPHAGRTVPPGTGLTLSDRASFSHSLLPAAVGLRPAAFCGAAPPRLSWAPLPAARAYRVQVARDAQLMEVQQDLTVQDTHLLPQDLAPGKYFWRVLPLAGQAQGLPSKIFSFVVAPGASSCP